MFEEFKVSELRALALWLPLAVLREARSFVFRMIETFVSFVNFVVNKIGQLMPSYPQESLKTHKLYQWDAD
jgi:hypothetical protein